uniref:Uncharacterized protein n=1 Tax=Branchiostoma floridae TaxID=7739 RepID=C3ZW67_BRAFL|eukprot:XP_002587187.1 hypothetical protein BRAFLDRAFT_102072 [Branchiostoma floridae]
MAKCDEAKLQNLMDNWKTAKVQFCSSEACRDGDKSNADFLENLLDTSVRKTSHDLKSLHSQLTLVVHATTPDVACACASYADGGVIFAENVCELGCDAPWGQVQKRLPG